MTKLEWDGVGERFFHTGVDHGVLYPPRGPGVAWNGLISIDEAPAGGGFAPRYLDGVKYLNESGAEEFNATITAYTYPEEFSALDGSLSSGSGLYYEQQNRKPFHLSYRTKLGNDTEGSSYGYKLHLIYNASATPTSRSNKTLSGSPEVITFSWGISCLPVKIQTLKPLSHLIIDSTKTDPLQLQDLENILYGVAKIAPRMPTLSEVVTIFDDWTAIEVIEDVVEGLSPLIFKGGSDLKGDMSSGLYSKTSDTRLNELAPGLYSLD